jgi:threonine 3-dehydrogenase
MNDTMKALVKNERAEGLWMCEVERPVPGPCDVLIRIHKTAICGTDVHIYNWDEWSRKTIPVPMTIGHEFSGEIAAVGEDVVGFSPGERVSGEGHVVCGQCRNCRAGRQHLCGRTRGIGVNRAGAFAEYLAIPVHNVFKLPADVSDETGALLDPLGNAVHTALSFDLVGEDVLITGAGPIGIMAGAVAAKAGARHVVITDVNPYRLELAAKMGVERCVNVSTENLESVMAELGMLEGFDVGMEMSGHPTAFRDMLGAMIPGGRVAVLGIPPGDVSMDLNTIVFKGLTLKGVYGREMFETWYKMVALLQNGLDVSGMVTHRFDAQEFREGFETMRSGRSGKVTLDWTTLRKERV